MDFLLIDTKGALPVYQQIVEQIRTRVRDGALLGGDPLPSVRQLASDLGINPNTVAKAYMLLERDSVIETVRRRGTFIAQNAKGRIVAQTDKNIGRIVDRMVEEASRLGVDPDRFLHAMRKRISTGAKRQERPKRSTRGGEKS